MKHLPDIQVPERPRKKPELVGEEMEGMNEVIYVDTQTGSNYSLNIVAATILELCDGTHTGADIAAIILSNLDADPGRVRSDTLAILEEFAAYGLIRD
ncbi:MAG TPA: PqqD family protein [Mariprofundaceae bacterium]|nr:PqqD family protein [Mariprofundaceae bacterium]